MVRRGLATFLRAFDDLQLVGEASDGSEVVSRCAETHPDVILMDLSLPVMDGLTATRRIRTLPELKDVPIVVVTAHDTADFHAAAMASGCDEYVTKPIDFLQLESLLEHLLPTS